MAYPPSLPPYPQELPATSYSSPPPALASLPFNQSTPPPPPPKPSSHDASRISTPQNGPPLPPPPETTSYDPNHQQQQQQQQQTRYPQPADAFGSADIPPPGIDDGWLPDTVRDKSKPDLSHLLSHPPLLSALTLSPRTTHPSQPASLAPLAPLLATNLHLATALLALSSTLSHQRATTSQQLLHLHALERQWRQKQTALDDALAPFAPKALHQRLVASIAEQEAYLAALEESFLEGEGKAGERETGEMVKRWREGRRLLEVRRERRERWEEGRVGGWR
ncbi:hypothetical protein MMC18_001453 [Xylographa bjoerkii]|nr:hypothetical protein [Xylographa bjoerkii]